MISPLLANVYLNPIDQAFECSGLGVLRKGSVHLVRYADDMLVLARWNLDEGIALLKHYVGRLGLELNGEKTRRVRMEYGQSVDFLGFRFLYTQNRKTGKRMILVYPSPESQQRCRDEIRKRVHHTQPMRLKDQISELNEFLRGWVGYFRLGNGSAVFSDLAYFTEKRIRRVLQRRRGRRGMDGIASAGIDFIGSLVCSLTIGCVGCSPLVLPSGKPYEGKPHVRFDEGSMETG